MENVDINPFFWRGKRVFVTGHTGFKGAWLCEWLLAMGAEVTGYALSPPTQPSLFELADLNARMHSIIGDVRDLSTLHGAAIQAKPDIIFHLAAQPLVRYSYHHPVETYATNVMGTVNILEVMRTLTDTRVCINVTTDKCYENKEYIWGYREHDRLGGFDPYSSSKACSEMVTHAYRQSFFSHKDFAQHQKVIASARAGNVLGGGDWAQDRLVPDIISALARAEKPFIRYAKATRPWQHVLEPLSGYLLLAEKLWQDPQSFAGAWNFGPYDSGCQTVAQVADAICSAWGEDANWQTSQENHLHEAAFLKLDISKSQSLLKWQPRFNFLETIQQTVQWYQQWLNGVSVSELTQQQIQYYMNKEKINA